MALLSGSTVSNAIQDPKNELVNLVSREKDDKVVANELFLRVLSREATAKELEATQKLMSSVEVDHREILAQLEAKEKEQAPVISKMEAERQKAIASTKAALEAYEAQTKFYREERETLRKEREMRASETIKTAEAGIDQRVEGWIATLPPALKEVSWMPVVPDSATGEGALKLTVQKDGSVLSSGPNTKASYTLTFNAQLKGVTALVLEVLPEASLPGFGPGRSKDGNFILNEVVFSHAPKAKPAGMTFEKFSKAFASFSQPKYGPENAIDGKEEDVQNGWAISGGTQRRQFAVFQFSAPFAEEGMSRVTLNLVHKNRDTDQIGRFRVYMTSAENPLREGLPSAVLEALSKASSERVPAQKGILAEHVRTASPEYWRQNRELVDAKAALSPDPRHTELKNAVSTASEPIKLDPVLVQLRVDSEASKKQTANKRLTVVQDLTWALINNPAFLFNR
jgi:hypothetical protein